MANPIAMIASFGMALRYSFDMGALADKVDAAIAAVLASGLRTADIKSEGTTAVIDHADGRGDPEGDAEAARADDSSKRRTLSCHSFKQKCPARAGHFRLQVIRRDQYSGKRAVAATKSDGGLSGWRSIGRL